MRLSVLKILSHFGILSSFLIGAWLDWHQLSLVCAAAPLMLVVTVQYEPETPSYLLLTEQMEQAEGSLQWLRGKNADIFVELAIIQVIISTSKEDILN